VWIRPKCDSPFCDWQDITGWGENDRGVSFTFGGDVVRQFLKKHGFSLIARAHQVRVRRWKIVYFLVC